MERGVKARPKCLCWEQISILAEWINESVNEFGNEHGLEKVQHVRVLSRWNEDVIRRALAQMKELGNKGRNKPTTLEKMMRL